MECYALQLVTPPTDQPVDFARAKRHLRIEDDFTIDDDLIASMIDAVIGDLEDEYGYAFCTQTWKAFFNYFPCYSSYGFYAPIRLPKSPLQTVTHIKYYDGDGVLQTLSPSDYTVDAVSIPGKITPAYGSYWPSVRSQPNAVEVQFVCGYGAAAAVPPRIEHEILIRLTEAYEHRGDMEQDNLKRSAIIGSWSNRLINV